MQKVVARGPIVWGAAVLALVLALALATLRRGPAPSATPSPPLGPAVSGEIDLEPQLVPQPPGYVTTEDCARFENRWVLRASDPGALGATLRALGLSPAQSDAVTAAARCEGGRCVMAPPLDVLEALSPTVRGAVQEELARLPDNALAATPFWWPTSMPAWSTSPTLSPRARSLLEHATFTRNGEWLFMDVPLACAALGTDDERRALLAVLKWRAGLRAWVRVPASGDLDAMARYWSASAGDVTEVRARLETARGGRLDVRELLPPVPRARVGTFPSPQGPALDCYWTALHFFDPSPSTALPDIAGLRAALAASYAPVEPGTEAFGDLVVLYSANDEPVHAFNHIAAGLVFSKDGGSRRRPWLLQRFDAVRRGYPAGVTARVWRRRP